MSAINSITESWNNHTFQEVETHIKGNYMPGENRAVLTNTNIWSLGPGLYTSPFRSYINGTPPNINLDNAIALLRINYHSTGSTAASSIATIVFDLESTGIYVRRNDTDAQWILCAT